MIADLKPYPRMKDSGVEWLGEVPEHWDILPGRACIYQKQQPNIGIVEDTVLSLSYGRIVVKPDKLRGLVPESFETYQVVDPGDILCRPTDLQNDRTSLRFGISRDRGIITSAYICFSARPRMKGQFAHLLFHAYDLKKVFYGLGSGLRQNLSWEDFKYLPCAAPPLPEQVAIIRYLHHLDRRVRRLVRAKRKLIDLLEEQRHGIIHGAVTRGLDPQVPMKDSGIEWMGEVPAHWEVLALKRVLRRLIDCEHKTAPAVDGSEFRVVRTTAVRNGTYDRLGTYGTTPEAYREWTRRGVPEPGDVIFTREAPAGEACLVPGDEPVCLGQRTVLMKPRRDEYSPEFLVHTIYAGPPRIRIQLASQGSTVGHFNMDDIGWMRVYKPPLPEQLEIVDYLSDATRDIDSALARATAEIELLNEYRTRLTADVVTGKLDVRDAAAAMPEVDPVDVVEDLADSSDPDIEMALGQLNAAPAEADE